MAAIPVQDDVDAFSDSYTNDFVNTPPGSPSGDRDHPNLIETGKLQAGHTYVIRSVSCGRQLTLLNGDVLLNQPASLGSVYWTCVESDGWLGFRNVASGKHLRHGGGGPGLHCSNHQHDKWERIQIRPHSGFNRGFTLLMEYFGGLKPVGTRMGQGVEILERLYEPGASGLSWIFLEVS